LPNNLPEVSPKDREESSMNLRAQWTWKQLGALLQRLPYVVFFFIIAGPLDASTADKATADAMFFETVRFKARQAECSQNLRASCVLEEAIETTYGIGSADTHAAAIGAIAEAQVRSGNVPAALGTAKGIKDDQVRAKVLSTIAEAQVRAGDVPAALEMIQHIADQQVRVKVLGTIAAAQVHADDVVAVQKMLQQEQKAAYMAYMPRRKEKQADYVRLAGTIAEAEARAGDQDAARATFATALQVAREIEPPADRAKALRALAAAHARAGDQDAAQATFAAAFDAAHDIAGAGPRLAVQHAISAQAQVHAGDVPTALETARHIADQQLRDEVFSTIAAAQVHADDVPAALETVRSLEAPWSRVAALRAVVEAHASDTAAMRTILAAASEAVRGIAADGPRIRALGTLAAAHARAGDQDEARVTLATALETARGIGRAGPRAEALAFIAATLGELGLK
jgi:hypothetical protein